MTEQKGNRKMLWMYAVAIFTFAIFILLLTFYSQMKFNKNIDDYKNRLSEEEALKFDVQKSLSDALNENKSLKGTIDKLSKDLQDLKIKGDETEKKLQALESDNDFQQRMYERIISAQNEYINGNLVACATILLETVQYDKLNALTRQSYDILKDKAFRSAAELLYYEGYKYFRNRDYATAAQKFYSSTKLCEDEYFSDDSYYFLAYSLYYSESYQEAKLVINSMLEKYPDSTYKNEAKRLLANME